MRARFVGILATSAALIVSATVAVTVSADPVTWTVSEGGAFNITAGEIVIEVEETGVQFVCASSSGDGTAQSGSGLSNPLATIPEPTGVQFDDCSWAFFLTFEIDQVGDWALNGVSYDGTDVTTATLDDVAADILGPNCQASVSGSMNVTYVNSTGVLQVLPDFTLEVTFVDPTNNCYTLINEGEHISFSGAYAVTPGLAVTSP
jgi:hypothetical protein